MARNPMDSQSEQSGTKVVGIFANHESADLALANLEAHGIEGWTSSNDAGGMLPNLSASGGVRVSVRLADAASAEAILQPEGSAVVLAPGKTIEVGPGQPAPHRPPPSHTAERMRAAPRTDYSLLVAGLILGFFLATLFHWWTQLGTRTDYVYKNGVKYEARLYRDEQLIEIMKDRNLDGSWDQWTYYEGGQRVRTVNDNNFDGQPDETAHYTSNTLVALERDTDFNGVPDEFYTYQNEVVSQVDIQPNNAKIPNQRWLYKNGVLTEILRNPNAAGQFTESIKYDAFSNPVATNRLK
jgi:hypothetical protein